MLDSQSIYSANITVLPPYLQYIKIWTIATQPQCVVCTVYYNVQKTQQEKTAILARSMQDCIVWPDEWGEWGGCGVGGGGQQSPGLSQVTHTVTRVLRDRISCFQQMQTLAGKSTGRTLCHQGGMPQGVTEMMSPDSADRVNSESP